MSVSDFHFRQMVLLAAGWTQMSANDPVGNFLSRWRLMGSDLG